MLIDHSKLAPTLKFYATALPLKVYGLFIFILLSVGVGLILWAHGMGDSDFTIFMTLAACVFIGPCLAICLFRAVRQFKLYKSGEIILEFGSDEMRCNSKISGPIGTIEWPDVADFHPVIAMASPYAMVMIEHIHRPTYHETHKIYVSRYLVNSIDLDADKFIALLEKFTGKKAGKPRRLQF